MKLEISDKNYEIGKQIKLDDKEDGHNGEIGEIIKVKKMPFAKQNVDFKGSELSFPGLLLDIKFKDGYILPDVLPSEVKVL